MLREGFMRFRCAIRVWPLLYTIRLVVALLYTLPVLILTSYRLDSSQFARPLLRYWSLDVIGELVGTRQDLLPVLLVMLFSFAIIAFLLKQFLNGGLYDAYLSGCPFSAGRFFSEGGSRFTTNLQVSLLMVPVYLALGFIGLIVARLIPTDLTGYFGEAAAVPLLLRFYALYPFLIFGAVFSDILRIRRCTHPAEGFAQSLRATLDFYRRHWVKLNVNYYGIFLPFVVFWLLIEGVGLLVTESLPVSLGVGLELMLFQVCALARTGQSLLFTAEAAGLAVREDGGRYAVSEQRSQ